MIENNFFIVLRFKMINKLSSTLYVNKGGKVNNPIKKKLLCIETHQQDNKNLSAEPHWRLCGERGKMYVSGIN